MRWASGRSHILLGILDNESSCGLRVRHGNRLRGGRFYVEYSFKETSCCDKKIEKWYEKNTKSPYSDSVYTHANLVVWLYSL